MKKEHEVARVDTMGDPSDSPTAPSKKANRHVWQSRRYGWVARVVHGDGSISIFACDTEAEARTMVAIKKPAGRSPFEPGDTECPRCGNDTTADDIIGGRCSECRLAEEEADWADEAEGPLN